MSNAEDTIFLYISHSVTEGNVYTLVNEGVKVGALYFEKLLILKTEHVALAIGAHSLIDETFPKFCVLWGVVGGGVYNVRCQV